MESYIPLVKAIIISTMFTWGTSEVVITDQYIFKESNHSDVQSGNEEKEYEIYNLKSDVIHKIDNKQEYRVSMPLDTIDKYFINTDHLGIDRNMRINDTKVTNSDFGEFKCKLVAKEIERWTSIVHNPNVFYTENSYFAKISWLDTFLNTEVKRKFAGFNLQEYSPYHYLIYQNEQYPNQEPKDKVLRIIEKKEVDTTFIHTLLSLPLSDN